MGSLTSKLSKTQSAFKKCPARIAMIGLDGAGKTSILYRFKLNETLTTLPTIGFNVETLTPIKGLTLTVWDMGGQERMRPLWRMYLRGTDGVIFVVDSADKERLYEAKDELSRLLDTPEMQHVPLLVVANKQDLAGALDTDEISKQLGLYHMVSRVWTVQGTCAMTGDGVCEAMECLANLVKEFKSKRR